MLSSESEEQWVKPVLIGRSDLGIATHYIPKSEIDNVVAAIEALPESDLTTAKISSLLMTFTGPLSDANEVSTAKTPSVASHIAGDVRTLLDRAFSKPTVKEIRSVLQSAVDGKDSHKWSDRAVEWARQTLKTIGERSPTGMKVALLNWRQARKTRDLREQLDRDLRMCCAFLTATNDMFAGVDQVLVHKSKEPAAWDPKELDDPRIEEGKLAETWFDRAKSETLKRAPTLSLAAPEGGDDLWGTFRSWGLPSEAVIQSYIDGSRASSDAFALTRAELKERLWADLVAERELSEGEKGVAEFKKEVERKVEEVCERQCVLGGDDGKEGGKYLKWHPVAKL